MQISFYKYEGAGNDFIMIDNRKMEFNPLPDLIAKLCDRHFGIGADGLILLENNPELDFSMRYFNADGYEGSMCGNGGRCIALFAKNMNVIGDKAVFSAIDGLHVTELFDYSRQKATVKLKMNDVENVMHKQDQWIIDTGSPHLIIPVENPEEIDVFGEGRRIRYSELFAMEGINVNFVNIKGNAVRIRTYERGVENETLACGTGAVAAAVAAASGLGAESVSIEVKANGGNLWVHMDWMDGKFSNVWLEGPAKYVFSGIIDV